MPLLTDFNPACGRLYIVGTPIGNLGDLSPRALQVLREVDLICAEDTRVTGQLLQHYGIRKELISLREHNENKQTAKVTALLAAGKNIAQVTDAGMPGICDPGWRLVKTAHSQGIMVVSVPGPAAVITALSISGINAEKFYFGGFLPAKAGEREAALQELLTLPFPAVYYESPHRILATLTAADNIMPARILLLARELTKKFETVLSGTAAVVKERLTTEPQQQKGEMVLIFTPSEIVHEHTINPKISALAAEMAVFMPLKKITALLAETLSVNKKELYRYLLSIKKE